ncbi:hypothetical protein COEREDRAFT_88776 [Coemansia reversa NRRL 1564]|uniref:Ig-like domain-containing protein n=1 Tax=Coemansia reversa (strain ATCC 12441 / NRRL 1564) TaxID=763665 RepID=A0A2G5B5X4_COERN|nr:hypothetical protein COEREDRAFT_88776 [Coemansia reversa NRRL 1564]|eukprot:PIA14390.1 hypothetical protein COEREDRAFT_88776 [Coemansia reversa NRRL 1564]
MPLWNNMPPPSYVSFLAARRQSSEQSYLPESTPSETLVMQYGQTSDEEQLVRGGMMVPTFDGQSDTKTDTNWEDGSDSDTASEASEYEPSSHPSSYRDNSNSDSEGSSCGHCCAGSSASSVSVLLILAVQHEQNQPDKNMSDASTMTETTADVLPKTIVRENIATTTMEIDCARERTVPTSREDEWAEETQIRSENEEEGEAEDTRMLEDIIEDGSENESTNTKSGMEIDMLQGNVSNSETCDSSQWSETASNKIDILVPTAPVSENAVSQHTTEQIDFLYEIPQELPHMEIVRETPLPSSHANDTPSIMPMPLVEVRMPREAYSESSTSLSGRDYLEGCRFSCQIEGGVDIAIPPPAAMPWHPREFSQIPESVLPPTIPQVGVQMRIPPTNSPVRAVAPSPTTVPLITLSPMAGQTRLASERTPSPEFVPLEGALPMEMGNPSFHFECVPPLTRLAIGTSHRARRIRASLSPLRIVGQHNTAHPSGSPYIPPGEYVAQLGGEFNNPPPRERPG